MKESIEIGDAMAEMSPHNVRLIWAKYVSDGGYEPAIGCIKDGNKYDLFGLLCLALCDIGMDALTPEEWARTAPPARVCRAAGIQCKADKQGQATRHDYELIESMIDNGMPSHFVMDILLGGDNAKAIKNLLKKASLLA